MNLTSSVQTRGYCLQAFSPPVLAVSCSSLTSARSVSSARTASGFPDPAERSLSRAVFPHGAACSSRRGASASGGTYGGGAFDRSETRIEAIVPSRLGRNSGFPRPSFRSFYGWLWVKPNGAMLAGDPGERRWAGGPPRGKPLRTSLGQRVRGRLELAFRPGIARCTGSHGAVLLRLTGLAGLLPVYLGAPNKMQGSPVSGSSCPPAEPDLSHETC